MASKSPTFCLKLCAITCMAMLFSSTVAAQGPGLIPRLLPFPAAGPPSSQQVHKCWSSLEIIPGCVMEIYGALLSGQLKTIGRACCKAITEVQTKCWQIMLPLNPHFPPLLNSTCAQSGGTIAKLAVREVALPSTGIGNDLSKCLSSITNIPGCLLEVYGSLVSGNFLGIGPACCKVITKMTGSCWSRLFPFNPYFPPLLKGSCGCAASAGNVNVPSLTLINLTFQGPGLLPTGPAKCWRFLASIPGCVLEIYGALSRGQFGSIGPACCKATTHINNSCWAQMFPMNPLFPPLLINSCARPAAAALAPHPPPK